MALQPQFDFQQFRCNESFITVFGFQQMHVVRTRNPRQRSHSFRDLPIVSQQPRPLILSVTQICLTVDSNRYRVRGHTQQVCHYFI